MIYKSPIQGWRQYAARYRLQGIVCVDCNKAYFPQKYICLCGSSTFRERVFNGIGKLISFTNISNSAIEFKDMPQYCIGLIQLDDGPVIIAQITDAKIEDLSIGARVVAVFRKNYTCGSDGVVEYGLKFTLI